MKRLFRNRPRVRFAMRTGGIVLLLSGPLYAQGQSSPNVPNPLLPGGNTIAGPGIVDFARDVDGGATETTILELKSGLTIPICVTVRNEDRTTLTLSFSSKETSIGPGETKALCGNHTNTPPTQVKLVTDTEGQGLAQWRVDVIPSSP